MWTIQSIFNQLKHKAKILVAKRQRVAFSVHCTIQEDVTVLIGRIVKSTCMPDACPPTYNCLTTRILSWSKSVYNWITHGNGAPIPPRFHAHALHFMLWFRNPQQTFSLLMVAGCSTLVVCSIEAVDVKVDDHAYEPLLNLNNRNLLEHTIITYHVT